MNIAVTSGVSGSEIPLEAVWAGVAAVVIAALIAAVAAHLRTRLTMRSERERLQISLKAEQKRLEAQLKAESDRQLEALSHDRVMRDVDEIRVRLDEVIDVGEAALSAVCSARNAHLASDVGGVIDQVSQAEECLGQSGYKERRLRLRIGIEHEVVTALVKYRESIRALLALVKTASEQGQPIPRQEWNNGMGGVAAAQVKVISVGRAAVGAHMD